MPENEVIILPKKEIPKVDFCTGNIIKKRVAAYARVSTDQEDQLNSLETQKREYERRILENPEWEYVGLYADEGITGTNLKKREDFKRMIQDAKEGKIDLILVKSISRFARNTVDCIQNKRILEEIGVEVYFEKENIHTLSQDSETMITIYASFAQEESRQISTNVTWGIRARMREGSYRWYRKGLLGYKMNENDELVIDEEGAKTVKLIFEEFLLGYTYREIIKHLEELGYKNGKGETKWDVNSIHRVLTNEKYCGDIIFQKTYCNNYLTHERKINKGEKEQYYLPHHHEPIIDKATFLFAQTYRLHRKDIFDGSIDCKGISAASVLTYCAKCGRQMKKIQYYKGKPWSRCVLTCKGTTKASQNHMECDISSTLDFEIVNSLISDIVKKELTGLDVDMLGKAINDCEAYVDYMNETEKINRQIESLEKELTSLVSANLKCNFSMNDYQERFNDIQKEIKRLNDKLSKVKQIAIDKQNSKVFMRFLKNFLEDKEEIIPRIALLHIKRIYRLEDNSLLIIKSHKDVLETELETIRKNIHLLSGLERKIFTFKDKKIEYTVLELEDKNVRD